jgi:hydroxymethylpyrimidine pyrophosphatase-like HAD family hydrolase
MNINFDCDGCLIDGKKPIDANIELLKTLSKTHKVYIWSGNGYEYSYKVALELGISNILSGVLNKYGTFKPDIAFDNQEIDLGKLNIKI